MDKDEGFKIAYQSAIDLSSAEMTATWSAFYTIMASNTALVALNGALLQTQMFQQAKWFFALLAVLGILGCFTWYCVTARHFCYASYWLNSARALETDQADDRYRLLQIGRCFSEGATVHLPDGGPLRMGWSARIFRIQWLSYFIIFMFATLHLVMFVVIVFSK